MKAVDIILIKPGSQKGIYGELSDFQLTAIEPPLWGAILAGYLRDLGYSVLLFDAEAENWDYKETAQKAAEADPLLTAVVVSGSNPSASTMNMTGAGKIITHIKELQPEANTLLWGLHPSALPERTTREEDADFVCQGEGFTTLPSLLDALKAGETHPSIPGLWHKNSNQVFSNPPPPPLSDLAPLPMPAWDLLPMEKYRAHNWHCFGHITERQPYAVIYTSLGCPFKCNFCCINSLFGKRMIRYRPLDQVFQEIDFLVENYDVKNIKIMDEMFVLNEKRVIEFCDKMAERKYELNFWAYARVNTVNERMLSRMKQAGINWLAYGFESGNKRVIENISKGYRTEDVMDVVEMTYANDIHICANYIFGLPEDDYDSMNDTLKLMLDINAEWANIYCAMAYPGSELYEAALKNHWKLPESWQAFSQYSYETLPLQTKYLSGGQVLAFRDYTFNTNFKSPRYLKMIKEKFDRETASYIKNFSKTTLKRKYKNFI